MGDALAIVKCGGGHYIQNETLNKISSYVSIGLRDDLCTLLYCLVINHL